MMKEIPTSCDPWLRSGSDEDKHPFVLFSPVSAEPLRRTNQSGKYRHFLFRFFLLNLFNLPTHFTSLTHVVKS